MFPFKELLKARFESLQYLDLVLDNGKVEKAAWVLPLDGQTRETGTLADFIRTLGVTVEEVDMDEDEDEDDDASRDGEALVDEEAEEAGEEEEEEEEQEGEEED